MARAISCQGVCSAATKNTRRLLLGMTASLLAACHGGSLVGELDLGCAYTSDCDVSPGCDDDEGCVGSNATRTTRDAGRLGTGDGELGATFDAGAANGDALGPGARPGQGVTELPDASGPDAALSQDGAAATGDARSPDASSSLDAALLPVDAAAAFACVDGGALTSAGLVRSDLGFAPVPALADAGLTRIPLAALTLVADRARKRLYALAAADDPSYPDQLVSFDSATGSVLGSIAVGANPSTLSLADEGSTLWVGSAARFEIRRVDLAGASPRLAASHALPEEWQGSIRSSLVVVPPFTGASSSLIDLRTGAGTYLGQVTLSPGAAAPRTPSGGVATRVTAGPPGYFFAYNDYDSGFEFYTIDATGPTFNATPHAMLIYGYGRDVVYDPDGVVYATTGEVIDVRIPSAPRRSGRFASGGRFIPMPGSDRVVLAHEEGSTTVVADLLDTRTFTRISRLQTAQLVPAIRSTVALDGDRVAFLAGNGQDRALYLSSPLPSDLRDERLEGQVKDAGAVEFSMAARALVFDAKRQLLYAAVSGASERYANRIVSIDPARGQIVNSVSVGSNPNALALSEDASVLWVSLQDSSAVRRIDLACDLPLPGAESDLPLRTQARRLFPLPGRPGSVAAQLAGGQFSPSYSGTAFFDDGGLRPGFNQPFFGAARMVAGPPGIWFAYDDETSGYVFYTIRLTDMGPTQQAFNNLLSGYNRDIAYDPDGFVYSTEGEIVDVTDPFAPKFVGRLPRTGAVLPLAGPQVLMVSGSILWKLDASTLLEVGSRSTQCSSSLTVTDLIRVGPHRVAYLAFDPIGPESGTVCIIEDAAFLP